jgi:hypothetical protein
VFHVCIPLVIVRVLLDGIRTGKVITKPYKTRLLRFELNFQVIGFNDGDEDSLC